jgi:hypothetical protein
MARGAQLHYDAWLRELARDDWRKHFAQEKRIMHPYEDRVMFPAAMES